MLAYFLTLSSEAHSEAWTPVLLLLFTQMEKLQVQQRSKSKISKVTFLFSRKRGWGDLLLQFILYYASSGALTLDQRWLSLVANDGAIRGTKKMFLFCSGVQCAPLFVFADRCCLWHFKLHQWGWACRGDVSIILVLMSIFLNFSSRWRVQHLDAETRRQFELHCDLVSEHHTSPCWWCLR